MKRDGALNTFEPENLEDTALSEATMVGKWERLAGEVLLWEEVVKKNSMV